MKSQKDALTAQQENAFLHRRRGELVIERDRARTALTRVYDILAGINDGVEVGPDGYARLASLNDRDQLQALCDELGAQTRFAKRSHPQAEQITDQGET
jgi:hypothetical protein